MRRSNRKSEKEDFSFSDILIPEESPLVFDVSKANKTLIDNGDVIEEEVSTFIEDDDEMPTVVDDAPDEEMELEPELKRKKSSSSSSEKPKRSHERQKSSFEKKKEASRDSKKKEDEKKKQKPIVDVSVYERMQSEIDQLIYDLEERNQRMTPEQRRSLPFYIAALASISRKLADQDTRVIVDERKRKEFYNVVAFNIFKQLMSNLLKIKWMKVVVSTLPDDILRSGFVGDSALILGILRGVPINPVNLNLKRKRTEHLPFEILKVNVKVKERDGNYIVNVAVNDDVSDTNVLKSEEIQRARENISLNNKHKEDNVDYLQYVADFETNPSVYKSLLDAQKERDFEGEEKLRRLKKRHAVPIEKPVNSLEGVEGLDLIDRMLGGKRYSYEQPIVDLNEEKDSLFSSSSSSSSSLDLSGGDKHEKPDFNKPLMFDAQNPDDYVESSLSNVMEDEVVVNETAYSRKHDEDMFKKILVTSARLARIDAEQESAGKSPKEINTRAEELWAQMLLTPNRKILPLSDVYYDESFYQTVKDLSIENILKGLTNKRRTIKSSTL